MAAIRWNRAAVGAVCWAAFARLATAAPSAHEVAEPPEAEVSAEEMRQLEQGLSSDAAGNVGILKPPPAALPPSPSAGQILQNMNPDLSVLLDVAAGGSTHPVDAQLGHGAHDPYRNGFNLQQLELYTAANVDPYLHFDATLVFDTSHIEIEEAFATTMALPANLQVRAGQFLTRFGRINPTHPHQWHFLNQPLVLQKFMGAEGNRGVGAEVSWLSPLPWYLEAVASATDPGGGGHGGATAASFLSRGSRREFRSLADPLYTGAVKQFFALSRDLSLLWGISGQTGPNARAGRSYLAGTDLYLRFRPLGSSARRFVALQVEALWRVRNWSAAGDDAQGGAVNARRDDYGGYADLIFGLSPTWETGVRAEWVSKVDDDFRDIGRIDATTNEVLRPMVSWPGSRQRYLAQVTFLPSHFSRLRLQVHVDKPSWRQTVAVGLFLGLEVAVGAHGAHSY